MKLTHLFGMLSLAAVPAFAQCPVNPLTALSGTWTFSVQTNQSSPFLPSASEFVIAGQFTASIGADRAGQPIGVLAITATSEFLGSTTRQERDAGRYQINADCTGGTITMNLSSFPMQYDFVFVNGGRQIYLISTLQGKAATGFANPGPTGCPAGVTNPLTLLSGSYAFSFRSEAKIENYVYGISGRFEASIGTDRAGQPIGLLAITATSGQNATHDITRLEKDAGRFQVNDDCSGGTLTFNLSSRPRQYQFYFRAGFQELDVVSTSTAAILGVASKAAAAGCPVGVNPLTLLSGINGGAWTFNAQSLPKLAPDADYAVAGRWVASTAIDRGGNTIGVLTINATSHLLGGTETPGATRLETDTGRFQIFDDCTGGTLTMNLSSFPMQYDFFFFNNGQSMYIVSTRPGRAATGSAHLGVTGCPAGLTNPLTLVSGIYSALIQRVPNFTTEAYGLVGLVGATLGVDRAGNPQGQLGLLVTSTLGLEGTVTRLERDAGLYQVEPDCTAGLLTFNLSSRPVAYQFYFRSGFQTMDLISLRGPAAYGLLSRF